MIISLKLKGPGSWEEFFFVFFFPAFKFFLLPALVVVQPEACTTLLRKSGPVLGLGMKTAIGSDAR